MNQQQLGQNQVSSQQAMIHQVQQAALVAQQVQQGMAQPSSQEQQHHQHHHNPQQQHHQHHQAPQQQQQQQQQQQPPQQPPQQQQQSQQHQQHPDQKQDNISRVKNLYPHLFDSHMEVLRAAGINIHNNANVDQGLKHAGEISNAKFEEILEKFYSLCDQMELNLKTAIEHSLQASASQRYTPAAINPIGGDNQKYAHYITTIKSQVNYVKDLHGELVGAASNVPSLTSSARSSSDHIASMDTSG